MALNLSGSIDGHVHLYPDQDVGRRAKASCAPPFGTVPELLANLDAAGISGAIVANFLPIASMRRAGRSEEQLWERQFRQNDQILTAAHSVPRLRVLAGAFAPIRGVALERLASTVEDPACVGIAIHASAGSYDVSGDDVIRIAEVASDADKALLVHAGIYSPGHPATLVDDLLRLIQLLPKCRVVVAHLGGGGSAEAIRLLSAGPNVWLDTSAVLTQLPVSAARGLLERILREAPPRRLIHGSDFPWYKPAEAADRLRSVLPPDVDPEVVFVDSASTVYGLND